MNIYVGNLSYFDGQDFQGRGIEVREAGRRPDKGIVLEEIIKHI